MQETNDAFRALDILIHAYFHQDMDLEAGSVPEAVANLARVEAHGFQSELRSAMARFELRYHNALEDAFMQRYQYDYLPDGPGQSVSGFFNMVRAILDDPEGYRAFEDAGW